MTKKDNPSIDQELPPDYPKNNWRLLIFFGFLIALMSGLAVNFFNSVHYGTELLQNNGQIVSLQASQSRERHDIKHIISTMPSSLNCLQLESVYAKNICKQHNNLLQVPNQP